MTSPRDLLKAWHDLSTDRCLSVETYLARGDELAERTKSLPYPRRTQLILRWNMLDVMQYGASVRPHEADPEAYWTARKALEEETERYLETTNG